MNTYILIGLGVLLAWVVGILFLNVKRLKRKNEEFKAAYHSSLEQKNDDISQLQNVRKIEYDTLKKNYDTLIKALEELEEERDELREVNNSLTNSVNETGKKLIALETANSTLKNTLDEKEKRYKALFCVVDGCNNLKYFKFNTCMNHTEDEPGLLDDDALNGERPVSGSIPLEDHDTKL